MVDNHELPEDIISVLRLDKDGKYVLLGGVTAKIFDCSFCLLTAPIVDFTYRFNMGDLSGKIKHCLVMLILL